MLVLSRIFPGTLRTATQSQSIHDHPLPDVVVKVTAVVSPGGRQTSRLRHARGSRKPLVRQEPGWAIFACALPKKSAWMLPLGRVPPYPAIARADGRNRSTQCLADSACKGRRP